MIFTTSRKDESTGEPNFPTASPISSPIPSQKPMNLTVSAFAGTGEVGCADGPKLQATFNGIESLYIDSNDNIYISERVGRLIRKIHSSDQVTTIAGVYRTTGQQNGPSSGATFNNPAKMCTRADGSLIIADSGNHVIRAISPDFLTVSTIAGNGSAGAVNNPIGKYSSFNNPQGVACDESGNIYVADYFNHMVN